MIVAFTGHRPDKLGGYGARNPLRDAIKISIAFELGRITKEYRIDRVLSGMALGVDQWAAEVALDAGLEVWACIPFEGQESIWPARAQIEYERIMRRVKERIVVCVGGYSSAKLQRRNEYMVDNCDLLIAVFDGSKGGTANTVRYAEKVGREIRTIDPTSLRGSK